MRPEDLLKVPAWLETHPELQRRGIVLSECLKPSFVYRTSRTEKPVRVVKILEDDEQEAAIYQRLQRDPARTDRRNPAIPCEVIRSQGLKDILLMPFLLQLDDIGIYEWSLSRFLEVFLQVVEGTEFLHEQRIAHLDICTGNTLVATENEARLDTRVAAGKVYIIDFHTSQQLRLGPGEQPAIRLSCTQIPPPRGWKEFDPYSWDVYCLGALFDWMAGLVYWQRKSPPWIARRIVRWLIGEERGCTQVCHCRPTARRARQVLRMLCRIVLASEWCTAAVARARSIFGHPSP